MNHSFLFFLFFILFGAVSVGVAAVFITVFVTALSRWSKNNRAPRLTVPATVVAKRLSHSYTPDANRPHMGMTHTQYHVTFQVESGDRMELLLFEREYGMLAEGDRGRLTFQGTRFLGFARDR